MDRQTQRQMDKRNEEPVKKKGAVKEVILKILFHSVNTRLGTAIKRQLKEGAN